MKTAMLAAVLAVLAMPVFAAAPGQHFGKRVENGVTIHYGKPLPAAAPEAVTETAYRIVIDPGYRGVTFGGKTLLVRGVTVYQPISTDSPSILTRLFLWR